MRPGIHHQRPGVRSTAAGFSTTARGEQKETTMTA
jgi:hypothetical protein